MTKNNCTLRAITYVAKYMQNIARIATCGQNEKDLMIPTFDIL